jgi:hypothetical protein
MNWPDRSDDGTCDRCGKAVNMDAFPPCPHGVCVCDTCERADVCPDCRREDQRDADYARCMAEPWTPHDLDETTTPTEARAAQAAYLAAHAAAQAEVARTYGEAGRTYATWLQTRNSA